MSQDRFSLECYDINGDLAFPAHDVDSPTKALLILGQRVVFDYHHATCYFHPFGKPAIAQWELEIK